MKVNRWDIYLKGRYIFHVYYMEDMTDDKVVADLYNKGYIDSVYEVQAFIRVVEKDR